MGNISDCDSGVRSKAGGEIFDEIGIAMNMTIYHMASKVDQNGNVSALCYATPGPIPLSKGQSWTLRPEAVTCKKCLAVMNGGHDNLHKEGK